MIEHLSAFYELSKDSGVTFLYCNYQESRTPSTYIRLALKQLCRRMPHLPPALEQVYELHNKNHSQPTLVELEGAFSAVIERFDRVFFILDALDECTQDQRKTLCEFVLGITKPKVISTPSQRVGYTLNGNSQKPGPPQGVLKLLMTSRNKPDFERAFLQNSIPAIEVEATKVDRDIEDYVKAQIQERSQNGSLLLHNAALKEKILTTLTTKADGMYVS